MEKEKLKKYSRILSQLVKKHYQMARPHLPEMRVEMIIDRKHHHYILMYIGWERERFSYFSALHFDIIEGKIWIQQNNTEDELVDELQAKGIEANEIVLAFLPPEMRIHSGFAVA